MSYELRMKSFLTKNKGDISFEDFNSEFYKKLKRSDKKFEEDEFFDFLTELYMKEPEVYKEWVSSFGNITYIFIKKNLILATYLISNEQPELLKVAYEMDQRKMSIISRIVNLPIYTVTIKANKNELLDKANALLELMSSEEEDNILRKAQEDFANSYGEYNENPYLKDYYNSIIDSFEKELLLGIREVFNKIESYDDHSSLRNCDDTSYTNTEIKKRVKPKAIAFRQTF